MERGLLVELSPNEETALQRIAQGVMFTMDMEARYLARLKQLRWNWRQHVTSWPAPRKPMPPMK